MPNARLPEGRMKFRCFKNIYHIAFHAEVLGVLIAMLSMGVFAASTMNSGRWVPPRTSIEFVSPVATAANETWPSKKVAFRPDGWSIARVSTLVSRVLGGYYSTPIITSDALITTIAAPPTVRWRSLTASFVIDDVITLPRAISTRTRLVVVPFTISSILPLI